MIALQYRIFLPFQAGASPFPPGTLDRLKEQVKIESFTLGGLILQTHFTSGGMELLVNLRPSIPVAKYIRHIKRSMAAEPGMVGCIRWRGGYSCISETPVNYTGILT